MVLVESTLFGQIMISLDTSRVRSASGDQKRRDGSEDEQRPRDVTATQSGRGTFTNHATLD